MAATGLQWMLLVAQYLVVVARPDAAHCPWPLLRVMHCSTHWSVVLWDLNGNGKREKNTRHNSLKVYENVIDF